MRTTVRIFDLWRPARRGRQADFPPPAVA